MLEKQIERYLIQEIKKLGGKAYKFVSPGNAGVPDRLVVLPNLIAFIELKNEKRKINKITGETNTETKGFRTTSICAMVKRRCR